MRGWREYAGIPVCNFSNLSGVSNIRVSGITVDNSTFVFAGRKKYTGKVLRSTDL